MFWGCVVAPGNKPTPFVPPPDGSRLHISQATLGPGAKDGARVALKVRTGEDDAESILLCAFRAGFSETTQLDILLSEYAELTIEGNTAIHVSGYYMPDFGDGGADDDDDDEEDEEDDEYGFPAGFDVDGDDDDDDDSDEEDSDEDDEDAPRPAKRSGVVIKELPAGADGDEEDEEDEEDSEEEAPPAPAARGKPNAADHSKNFLPLSSEKEKDKKRPAAAPAATPPAKKAAPGAAASPAAAAKPAPSPAAAASGKLGSQFTDGPAGTLGSRKFDNGLEIINLAAGKPNGKVALMGKRVQMKYVGRLKSNGKVFDASKGAPFTFRLGIGEVIKGWDIGVKGMRVGDKRKLIIPPDMAYGKAGARGAIPPNAWLEFDIELVNVLD